MSLYEVLGLQKNATLQDIKKAHLKLVRIHHPDKGGDPEVFKKIIEVYDILSDEKRRKLYDDHGITNPNDIPIQQNNGFGFPFNINDLFGNMFPANNMFPTNKTVRKGRKEVPTIQSIPITLEQFYLGYQKHIIINRQAFCSSCEHTGSKIKEMCLKCNGCGNIVQIIQMGPISMHTSEPCNACNGKGERIVEHCNICKGTGFTNDKRTLTIKILPGTPSQELFIFSEVCSDLAGFERPGDAHIIITEDPSDPSFRIYKRQKEHPEHLETTVTISLFESLLGCIIQLNEHPGYDDGLFIKLPPASFQNDVYRIRGLGIPISSQCGKYGDLFISINVLISLQDRQSFIDNGSVLLKPLFETKLKNTIYTDDNLRNDATLM